MTDPRRRRQLLEMAGAAGMLGAMGGCAAVPSARLTSGSSGGPASGGGPAASGNGGALPFATADAGAGPLVLPRLRASPDRITAITVCTRPFRPEGPRLDVERVGEQTVVHNYGHGGSGWSLSWGSGSLASARAMATSQRRIGVIGCGAIGLTTALQLQRAGAQVTIYARDLPPFTRSSLATGLWTPDSRICLAEHATQEFRALWEGMSRESWRNFQALLGLKDAPVEFIQSYSVNDKPGGSSRVPDPADHRPRFAELSVELLDDIIPNRIEYAPGAHPFGAHHVRAGTPLMFNLSAYTRLLIADFHANGGQIVVREFHSAGDLATLPQRTLVNATGYGAKALFGDQTLVPVRGQLARMIPQEDIHYGLRYRNISFVPRRDGLVFQDVGPDDYFGFGDERESPDRAEAENAVNTIAGLFS